MIELRRDYERFISTVIPAVEKMVFSLSCDVISLFCEPARELNTVINIRSAVIVARHVSEQIAL